MNQKIEAVIFDWAGTTVDYGSFAPVQAFMEAFEKYRIKPTKEEVRKPMGMLKIDHIRTMLKMDRLNDLWKQEQGRDWTEEDVKAIFAEMEKKELELLPDFAEVKPYVNETIAALRAKGIKIGSTTGYTDQMMDIVVPIAKKNGYDPDYWISPNSVGNVGRPYPYMIFHNMEKLGVSSVANVIKVGDTVADIKEGKNAGVTAVGVLEGSSVMGYTEDEYQSLSETEKTQAKAKATAIYKEAGADYVIDDMRGLLKLIG